MYLVETPLKSKIIAINTELKTLYGLSLIMPIQVNKLIGVRENFLYLWLYPGY